MHLLKAKFAQKFELPGNSIVDKPSKNTQAENDDCKRSP